MTNGPTTEEQPPPASSAAFSSDSRLERVLRAGQFAVTAELSAPDSSDPQDVHRPCGRIGGWSVMLSTRRTHPVQTATCRVSVSARPLHNAGYTPVLQISCRDRNRIAIQGDVLGAAALGISNILCLTGDGVQAGDQPEAKPVFDLGSNSHCCTPFGQCATKRSFFRDARSRCRPGVFIGGAANPFAPPLDFRSSRLAGKIEAGAQFIQTQYCFDVPVLQRYMEHVCELGLHDRCFILVGVGPLASARSARWIRTNVPGIHIPDAVIARLEGAEDQKLEGKKHLRGDHTAGP